MPLLKTVRAKTAVAIYLVAQIFFLINIQFPVKYDFDEFHYVPAAKEFLTLGKVPNLEHPPLAKMFMAVGIGLFGDRPIGWRVMSTLFGALTLVGMYFWAHALFKNEKYARWVVAITLVNQLLYVQARIGMLDTFMFGFLVWALACFTQAWDPLLEAKAVKKLLMLSGIFFGLATACKWFAVIPWFTCLGLSGMIFLFHSWGVSFGFQTSKGKKGAKLPESPESKNEFYEPDLWKGVRAQDLIVRLGFIPFIFYFITFIPYMFFSENSVSILDFFSLQIRMWGDQLRVVNSHPYMSQWKDWPLMSRPIWYAFDSDPGGTVRGVLLLGNPAVMWVGLLALMGCFWSFIRNRSREAFLIFAFYFGFFASWVFIPRKIAFYYYYYPAGMTLSLALCYVFYHFESSKASREKIFDYLRWGVFGLYGELLILFGHSTVAVAAGLFALLFQVLRVACGPSYKALFSCSFYAVIFLGLVFTPGVALFNSYYLIGVVASMALAYVFYRLENIDLLPQQILDYFMLSSLGISTGLFIYFFPILAALKIGNGEFQKWMWFRSWI